MRIAVAASESRQLSRESCNETGHRDYQTVQAGRRTRSTIEAVAERISALLPEDPRILREEFRKGVGPLLESLLNRMDLVTREEFDAQTRVLARTREKLEALERDVAALEGNGGRP